MKFHVLLAGLFFCSIHSSSAQYCNGSVGDPVVNITFGKGHELPPINSTSYQHVNGCPSRGEFTTSNLFFGCGDRTWVIVAGDHTGDQDGAFMVVNAESTPGIIYIDTAKDICGSTTYQLSAWITNVMQSFTCGGNAILPNITFTVQTLSGETLATYNTGDLPIVGEKLWKNFGLTFTTPPGITSAVFVLSTRPVTGCGSAFAIDDITVRICSPATVAATIDGDTGPQNVCADYTNAFRLMGSYTPGFIDPAIKWQSSNDTGKSWIDIPGATSFAYSMPRRSTGVIQYRFVAAERSNINSIHCITPSNTIYTNVHPLPKHQPPSAITGCIGKDFLLPAADPSALEVFYSGPNGYSSNVARSVLPQVRYIDTGQYILKQIFYFGCISTDTFHLNVFPGTTITTRDLYAICENTSVQLSASGEGQFQWSPSTGLSADNIANPLARPTDSTVYKVVLTNQYGCKDSALVRVNVFKKAFADAGPDLEIMAGDSVVLNARAGGTAVDIAWSPADFIDNSALLKPTIFPPQDTRYTLTATSTVGCGTVSSVVSVKVFKDIFVPTAFTPNGDGINDRFRIVTANSVKTIKFAIFNQWGQRVYEEADLMKGWDGNFKGMPQPLGIYVYVLDIKARSRKNLSRKGTFLLSR